MGFRLMHQKGGWLNPESSDWFVDYAKVVVDALSDRVTYWMTINEPQVFIGCGYAIGKFAPFQKLPARDLAQMSHNVLLAHGKTVKMIRECAKKTPKIGFAFHVPQHHADRHYYGMSFSWRKIIYFQ